MEYFHHPNRHSRQKRRDEPAAQDVERVMYPDIDAAVTTQQGDAEDKYRQQPTSSEFRRQKEKEENR